MGMSSNCRENAATTVSLLFAQGLVDNGTPQKGEHYQMVRGISGDTEDPTPVRDVRMSRLEEWTILSRLADEWTRRGDITHLACYPAPDTASTQLAFVSTGLQGALAIDLLAALTSPLGVYRCDCCNLPYQLERDSEDIHKQVRRPSLSGLRNHYCPDCRMDDYREPRKKKERERYRQRNEKRQRRSKYDEPVAKSTEDSNSSTSQDSSDNGSATQ